MPRSLEDIQHTIDSLTARLPSQGVQVDLASIRLHLKEDLLRRQLEALKGIFDTYSFEDVVASLREVDARMSAEVLRAEVERKKPATMTGNPTEPKKLSRKKLPKKKTTKAKAKK